MSVLKETIKESFERRRVVLSDRDKRIIQGVTFYGKASIAQWLITNPDFSGWFSSKDAERFFRDIYLTFVPDMKYSGTQKETVINLFLQPPGSDDENE